MDPPILASLLRGDAIQSEETEETKKSFVVIDVREEDAFGGSIRSSINIPAANFDNHVPELIEKYSHYDYVIFHCMHRLR